MKSLLFILFSSLAITACTTNKTVLNIPANQSIEIDYPNYDVFRATLKNKSFKDADIAVLSKENEKQIRGFGLGVKGKAEVLVEAENKLVIQNKTNSSLSLAVTVEKESRKVFEQKGEYINFTLHNTSAKSIPLIIPTVMNPNLSPFSKSGVNLKIGQEILFRAKGKSHVLLTVDNSIRDGAVIDIPKKLKQRKTELGLN